MTILVATDLTARADRALQRAASLAGESGEPLIVLHVVEEGRQPASVDARADAERAVAVALAGLRCEAPEIAVALAEGVPHEEIVARAAQADARLVVLGTRHRPGPAEMLRGTTVDNVVRRAGRPLLLVRDPVVRSYAKAVVGVDYSPHGVAAARAAIRLFPDCAFRLVHAFEVPFAGLQHGAAPVKDAEDDSRRRLDALVDGDIAPLMTAERTERLSRVVRRGTAAEVLRHEVRDEAADLVVTGTHGRTGLVHAMLGSVAEALLADPPCDVLVARAP